MQLTMAGCERKNDGLRLHYRINLENGAMVIY